MSRGPVIKPPTACSTIELKDLADVQDFEKNAEIGEVYAFEYTDAGFYKRKSIDDHEKPRLPKLEQLRNVTAEGEDNVTYTVTFKEGNWLFQPSIDWQLKFEFISPYTIYAPDKTFRKALNAGPVNIALAHEPASRGELEIMQYKKSLSGLVLYLLHRKDAVTKPSTTRLQFIPKFTLDDNYTIMFVLAAKKERAAFSFMSGIDLNWKDLDVESLGFAVVIKNSGPDVQGTISSDKVKLNVAPGKLTELSTLNLQHVDLIAFYYTNVVLSDKQLQNLLIKY